MAEIAGVDLSKKIGPVPIWVIVVGGGIAVAYFANRSFLGGGPTEPSGTVVESGVGGMPGGMVPAPQPDNTPVEKILDNEAWAFKAVAWLIGQGYNLLEAGIAVRKYLDSEPISSRELTMITMVSNAIGPPPNIPVGGGVITPTPNIPPPTPNPTPTPTPSPSPTLGHWAKVPRGSVPINKNGTSAVMDWLMRHNGYPGGINDVAGRTKIWYHALNVKRQAEYGGDWTRLKMEQWVFIPS